MKQLFSQIEGERETPFFIIFHSFRSYSNTHIHLGNFDQAKEDALRAIEINPDFPKGFYFH